MMMMIRQFMYNQNGLCPRGRLNGLEVPALNLEVPMLDRNMVSGIDSSSTNDTIMNELKL